MKVGIMGIGNMGTSVDAIKRLIRDARADLHQAVLGLVGRQAPGVIGDMRVTSSFQSPHPCPSDARASASSS